jgi:peptidoglycan/xylan/chitin deacetylase (PgdA/CDA1 family)
MNTSSTVGAASTDRSADSAAAARTAGDRGRLIVCFDFEGAYGMPHKGLPYDLAGNARAILDELAKEQAKAVFFVVGRMVDEHPEVVNSIAEAGHEIGVHGYEHDDMRRYDNEGVALFGKNLARVCAQIEQMSGKRPQGFRSPYLLAPMFYRSEVYAVLHEQGFRWVSNREVRYPVELLRPRPGKLPFPYAWRTHSGAARFGRNRLLRGPLNYSLVTKDSFLESPAARLRWVLGKREPFTRDGMTEVPVHAPLDCDLVGLPRPDEDSPQVTLDFSRAVVRQAATAKRGELSNVTFHDWLVTGGNRLVMISDALTAARESGTVISTIEESPEWLTATA